MISVAAEFVGDDGGARIGGLGVGAGRTSAAVENVPLTSLVILFFDMEYTEQQLGEIKKRFLVRRGRQKFVAIPLVVLMLALYFASDKDAGTVFGQSLMVIAPVFAVVLLGTAYFSWRNWRCPACDRYLGKGSNQKSCRKCGVALAD